MAGLLALLLLLVVADCGGNNGVDKSGGGDPVQQERNTAANEAGSKAEDTVYPYTVKDSIGTEYTFETHPKRIVSLSPSETEVLFALGLVQEIVGVSNLDNSPEAVKSKPKMGDSKVNVEAIVAAQPDLIVTAGGMIDDATFKGLADLGLCSFPRT